jgi:hypothetical protein
MSEPKTLCGDTSKPGKYEQEILFPRHITTQTIKLCPDCDKKRIGPCVTCAAKHRFYTV